MNRYRSYAVEWDWYYPGLSRNPVQLRNSYDELPLHLFQGNTQLNRKSYEIRINEPALHLVADPYKAVASKIEDFNLGHDGLSLAI